MFFKRKKKIFVELLKLVDNNEASQFKFLDLIEKLNYFFEQIYNSKARSFDLNYSKSYKTFNSLKKGILNTKEVIALMIFFGRDNLKESSSIVYSNPFLNWKYYPNKDIITLSIELDDKFYSQNKFENEIINLFQVFKFDYGYIHQSSYNLNPINNTISKQGIFSISTKSNGINWRGYESAIKIGFLKNIYQFNFLNESHIKNPLIKDSIEKTGELVKVNDWIYVWKVPLEAINNLKINLSVITAEVDFDNFKKDKSVLEVSREMGVLELLST